MKKAIFFGKRFNVFNLCCCSNDSFEQCNEQPILGELLKAPVTVHIDGFSISQGDIPATRATAVGDYNGVPFITLAFYASNGTEVYKHTQEKGNLEQGETFGEFSTSLMYGTYTMVVLANAGANAITLTSPTSATYGDANPHGYMGLYSGREHHRQRRREPEHHPRPHCDGFGSTIHG